MDNSRNEDCRGFRGLGKSFLSALREGELKPILDFEKRHRSAFLVEIRDNYLDLYYLGHAVKVDQAGSGYKLSSADAFHPERVAKWPVAFEDIKERYKNYDSKEYASAFEEFMTEVILEIVRHKKGDISEGVSEMNHYIKNRIAQKPGDILVIDRQVTYEAARIDLLGLKRQTGGRYSFVVVELKNRENKEIVDVFSQTKRYLDIIRAHYKDFQDTYQLILEQKIELGLLDRRNRGQIIDATSGKDLVEGLVILDNYNVRSSLLDQALKNWAEIHSADNMRLILKTNTFDERFMWDYHRAYETCNSSRHE